MKRLQLNFLIAAAAIVAFGFPLWAHHGNAAYDDKNPITIKGTREVLPSHGMFSRKGVEVHVTIHAPIETSPFLARSGTTTDAKAARDALMNEVRLAIASAL